LRGKFTLIEIVVFVFSVFLMAAAATVVIMGGHWAILPICLVFVSFALYATIRHTVDPDRLRARQTERVFKLSTQTLRHLQGGFTQASAEAVCTLLLPATAANAVAMFDESELLGYAGAEKALHPLGEPCDDVSMLKDVQVVSLKPTANTSIVPPTQFRAAILVPMANRSQRFGALKFYYRYDRRIDEAEQALAEGLGSLLSMQISLAELERQRELASTMELKALQAQINPHFLFNTINTIASLIRTDPVQARVLLREFASFYRYTLEGSLSCITLEQEYLQTLRYMGLMVARFGEDHIILDATIEQALKSLAVPSFIIQPVVENAITHARKPDEPLHLKLNVWCQGGEALIDVTDDGVGMDAETLAHLLDPNQEYRSIALRNVESRLRGFFGSQAGLQIQSELGRGTHVRLNLGHVQIQGMECL